jgi:hypothetical protein
LGVPCAVLGIDPRGRRSRRVAGRGPPPPRGAAGRLRRRADLLRLPPTGRAAAAYLRPTLHGAASSAPACSSVRQPLQRLPLRRPSLLLYRVAPPSVELQPPAVLPRPYNRRVPMDPTGGTAGKRWGGAARAVGEPVFAAPPDPTALESGFPRSSSTGAVLRGRLVGLPASCAERSREKPCQTHPQTL